ncbi:MBOAT family O-acyltransferase [Fundidesulfovibrio soli]|uniref:MBOAT family O-acyltransferase n=1 Tax=Fundidesulfovibrio soli TaxID=2922716 RepID=UPI001FAF7A7B|nr:MBOAT family protein [Fundidesulfovibrio soli]
MLFSSIEFIFFYLPITLGLYFVLSRWSHKWGIAWMAAASIFFYGWWKAGYLVLLGASILMNYFVGESILDRKAAGSQRQAKRILTLGVALNLALLLYYKYTNFLVGAANALLGANLPNPPIELPLGISFFTFTQTAYLVDCYARQVHRYGLLNYVLFVSYFPHLIAGPILHHNEMMPQFNTRKRHYFNMMDLGVGLTLFAMGLFKKVVVADNIAYMANIAFKESAGKELIPFYMAWKGSLAYTLQLYFDFSGYSDMALGLSRMVGIKLPVNFHSPYKARSAVDFWQRWHRTLSRFIRDYLYIPLGGSRKGAVRKYVNLAVSMFLAGVWHGAGWTFIVWGLMHAAYLMVNHLWRDLKKLLGFGPRAGGGQGNLVTNALSCLLTFLAVNFAWVMFRADTLQSGTTVMRSMLDFGKWRDYAALNAMDIREMAALGLLLAAVFILPNTQQVLRRYSPGIGLYRGERHFLLRGLVWKPTLGWALVVAVLLTASVLTVFTSFKSLEFLYFQF